MSGNRKAIARVWFISGDDTEDDPAWGMSPVRQGAVDEIAAWLVDQPETLTVTVNDSAPSWAREFLAARGLVSRAQS